MKKNILFIIFFAIAFFSCKQSSTNAPSIDADKYSTVDSHDSINTDIFLGNWESDDISENGTFSIEIFKNNKGELNGQYCSVARSGNKIDCSLDKKPNLKFLRQEGNEIVVSFQSFFGAKNGEAKLGLRNNKLYWEVIRKPMGEAYVPMKSYLSKKNIEKLSFNEKININSVNYKKNDVTMQLYKNIIDEYGCGENGRNQMTKNQRKRLSKDYDIEVKTVGMQKTLVENYKINEEGKIIKKK